MNPTNHCKLQFKQTIASLHILKLKHLLVSPFDLADKRLLARRLLLRLGLGRPYNSKGSAPTENSYREQPRRKPENSYTPLFQKDQGVCFAKVLTQRGHADFLDLLQFDLRPGTLGFLLRTKHRRLSLHLGLSLGLGPQPLTG